VQRPKGLSKYQSHSKADRAGITRLLSQNLLSVDRVWKLAIYLNLFGSFGKPPLYFKFVFIMIYSLLKVSSNSNYFEYIF